jgi:glutathione S-transferase
MSDYKLSYFDMKGGRGQVARLAFELGGVDFEDDRIAYRDFAGTKSSYPFGTLPILEHKGEILAQCNAINRFVGKLTDLYPGDP